VEAISCLIGKVQEICLIGNYGASLTSRSSVVNSAMTGSILMGICLRFLHFVSGLLALVPCSKRCFFGDVYRLYKIIKDSILPKGQAIGGFLWQFAGFFGGYARHAHSAPGSLKLANLAGGCLPGIIEVVKIEASNAVAQRRSGCSKGAD
jgi:hypothetical protein